MEKAYCPYCYEEINKYEITCPYCYNDLTMRKQSTSDTITDTITSLLIFISLACGFAFTFFPSIQEDFFMGLFIKWPIYGMFWTIVILICLIIVTAWIENLLKKLFKRN